MGPGFYFFINSHTTEFQIAWFPTDMSFMWWHCLSICQCPFHLLQNF